MVDLLADHLGCFFVACVERIWVWVLASSQSGEYKAEGTTAAACNQGACKEGEEVRGRQQLLAWLL